jgi:putative transposase
VTSVVTADVAGLPTGRLVAFIDSVKDRYGVEPVCRVLTEHVAKIAPSTYYAFKKRPPSARTLRDEDLSVEIYRIWHDRDLGRGLAGVRKMWHLLRRQGVTLDGTPDGPPVPRCTVERLMRALGLRGVRRGRQYSTTISAPGGERAPDLVCRDFSAPAPNRLWLVDFTYVPTWSGTVFTAFVTDVFSRRIVGWRTASAMPTELPLDALEMALWIRGRAGQDVTGVIHHSDAGSQYTALRYRSRLDDVGALASIGTVGDSYDNALAETVIGLYKTECIHREGPWRDAAHVELATCSWVDWFNTNRLHSALGYLTPMEYETGYFQDNPGGYDWNTHRRDTAHEHQPVG